MGNPRASSIVNASLATLVLVGGAVGQALADSDCDRPVGIMVSVQGSVTIDRRTVGRGDPLCPGNVITVGSDSRAAVQLFETQTVLRIDGDSEFSLEPAAENSTFLRLLQGAIYLFTREPTRFRIEEPYMNASVEGTEFIARSRGGQSEIIVFEGAVRANNAGGELLLRGGEAATASAGLAPRRRAVLKPFDSVQWALHYPPLEADDAEAPRVRRAARLLATGDVRSASDLLDQVLQVRPDDASALALKSIIALTGGDIDRADALANEALSANPNAAVAHTAKSFVLQGRFDLQGALRSAERAVDARTANNRAYAWSRLAELQASTEDPDGALRSARKALDIDPGISRTQSVLGFVSLVRRDTSAASQAFERAIELDQGDPLPRLGLGLARIERHRLAEGRGHIEIASALDPANALVRSYLGKSYFEEHRVELADMQLDMAKRLDPRDPTPWLYGAVLEQSRNRPVDALTELEASIARNDNRAVYRSSLGLDDDLAVRQSRLGLIYNNLGFTQRALLQGWRSTSATPSNFTAHRMLADSYWTLPRHELARDSELLQSQMLQPLNLNAVKPRLSSRGNFALSDTAQSRVGINEFSRVFAADGFRVLVDGQLGRDNTWSDDVIVSGLVDRFSYSVGQSHVETEGVRENNDTEQNFYNVFLQFTPRHDASFLLDYRKSDKDEGDREMLFDPLVFSETMRTKEEDTILRLGARYRFSARQTLLASYARVEGKSNVRDPPVFSVSVDTPVDVAELRYIREGARFDVDAGLSDIRGDSTDTVDIAGDESVDRTDIEHSLAYLYAGILVGARATVLLGASHDDIAVRDADFSTTNYKLGLLFDIVPATTVRLASFSAVNRPFNARQTLEPTSVAGFNQLYDDVNGTRSDTVGIGLDHRFDERTSSGITWSRRELRVPNGIGNASLDDDERVVTAYLYHAPSSSWSFSAQAFYEKVTRDTARATPETYLDTTILQVPIEARYFHPSGFHARVSNTYFDQDGAFFDPATDDFVEDGDSFWLLDLGVGQRLLGRRGLLGLEVRNVLDTEFRFQSTGRVGLGADTSRGAISRRREIVGQFTMVF